MPKMMAYIALLRGINVGGSGKLAMAELLAVCQEIGFRDVRTYIQSGNIVFTSSLPAVTVKQKLEAALEKKMAKPIAVLVRTSAEMQQVIARNPFQQAASNRVLVLFLHGAPPSESLEGLVIPGREKVHLYGREVYVHYPDGMGRSKLKLPLVELGTGRNFNTVTKLAAIAQELQ